MNTKYVTELKPYSLLEMCELLECSKQEAIKVINELKAYRVLKQVRASDLCKDLTALQDECLDVEEYDAAGNTLYYAFQFVGIVKTSKCIFKCIPKYIHQKDNYHDRLKTVIKVLKYYNSRKQIISLFNELDDQKSFNDLAVFVYLLDDYYEYGLYENSVESYQVNGSGEINWNRTINNSFAFLQDGRPYYTELSTFYRTRDEYDYFRRLHACVLTFASQELIDSGLADLFELSPVDLTTDNVEDFGTKEEILYKLNCEINRQFNTRKQLVLNAIYAFISQTGNDNELEAFSMFGTNAFCMVWQDVCSQVLGNTLNSLLSSLPFSNPESNNSSQLIDVILHPQWFRMSSGAFSFAGETDTLIPDIIAIEHLEIFKGATCFAICDAKYYDMVFEEGKKLTGNPGIESISKQHFYELAFLEFLKANDIKYFANSFLLPYEGNEFENRGIVSLPIFGNLAPIQLLYLPAESMYNSYLRQVNKTFSACGGIYNLNNVT